MAKTFALAFGGVYVLIGILGFVMPSPLLGIFGVNPLHNIVHLAIGALWLVAATAAPFGPDSARIASKIIGPTYLAVAVLGFVAPALFNALLNPGGEGLMADNLLHLGTGALATFVGFFTPRETVSARA